MKTARLVLISAVWVGFGGVLFAEEVKPPAEPVFQVRASAVESFFVNDGKIKKQKDGHQAIYEVNLPEKKIRRVAFYNPEVKEGALEGLQANDLGYDIVHYKRDFMKDQLLIKGIGMAGEDDGFETLVIGEDFVLTSRSTKGYLEITQYERTDAKARAFRQKKEAIGDRPESRFGRREPSRGKGIIPSVMPKIFRWRDR